MKIKIFNRGRYCGLVNDDFRRKNKDPEFNTLEFLNLKRIA